LITINEQVMKIYIFRYINRLFRFFVDIAKSESLIMVIHGRISK
jgi:hypothetical protein